MENHKKKNDTIVPELFIQSKQLLVLIVQQGKISGYLQVWAEDGTFHLIPFDPIMYILLTQWFSSTVMKIGFTESSESLPGQPLHAFLIVSLSVFQELPFY